MFRRLLFLFFQFVPLAAVAASPQGVWKGVIGTKAIIACFNVGSPWVAYGSYYYVDYLSPIALSTRETDSYWHEEGDTGRWELSAPVNGTVSGTWKNAKGKTLPINLTSIDGNDDESACARDSYNARLETRPKIEVGKIVQLSSERSYRTLRFAGQETIELIGPDIALNQINSLLKLDQSKEAVDAYFQQRREFLGRTGSPSVDERHAEPTYWDSNFITIRFYEWIAGTGRSGISTQYRTWDTKTGAEIDLWSWIGSSSSDAKLPSKLKTFLYTQDESSECADGYRGEGDFTLTLDKTGLHIDEDAWGSGCEKSFFIPYEKLNPFLSPSGKQAINLIVGEK